jgi:squalene-hopene/tetraprenyl-beta-curcumene cyclase
MPTPTRLAAAFALARDTLLGQRSPRGYWVGELSTSALSTAVAVSALSLVQKANRGSFSPLIENGLSWLAGHQNPDGGWGDTVKSFSNISTTMLCRAAFHLTGSATQYADHLRRCEEWLGTRYGSSPEQLAEAVRARYGIDRTFSVPILMTSALGGLVSWKEVPSLPFELACFPQSWFRFLRLPVVSYALPALIAIGQAVFHHRPPRNPATRLLRAASLGKALRVLETIQPSNGGFLEATPLTAFVTLGLASTGKAGHPVARKGVEFLVASVRPDGSWPIDTNLSTWVTTLSINALAEGGELNKIDRLWEVRDWLMRQQYSVRHPYTGADPGAFAWTPLPGGVPDADDTPGAILALENLDEAVGACKGWGVKNWARDWLLNLQNADGGWPTFCRGWGKLPFDRSGTDLTAHALRALWRLARRDRAAFETEFGKPAARGFRFLERQQRPDGSWLPLWFGNQHAPDEVNPTYGTAKVLAAYRDLGRMQEATARSGLNWLLANQNADGGWGAGQGTPSSIEETALAVEALVDEPGSALERGLDWLVGRVEAGGLAEATPIGFYFAKLWYFEKLYPIIFTVAALGRAVQMRRSE